MNQYFDEAIKSVQRTFKYEPPLKLVIPSIYSDSSGPCSNIQFEASHFKGIMIN